MITVLDWILIIAFCILFLASIYLIFLVFFSIKKAGKFVIGIRDIKYKNKVFILVVILLIIIINCIQFFKKPEMSSLLATSMLIMMFSANLVLQYFGIGIYENGIMYGGILHTWDKVKNYSLKNNLLVMSIKVKKTKDEFLYTFYFKDSTKEVLEKFLNSRIEKQ